MRRLLWAGVAFLTVLAAPLPAGVLPAGAATGRDVSTLKACEIVTPQEAATIIKGRLLNEPPAGFPNCAYVVDVDGKTESYRIAFAEPAMYVAMLEAETDAEKGEHLPGLWDEAYVRPRSVGDGFSVVVVRRGDLAMEVWGDRKAPTIEIAKLAVSRVK